ncbi:MAG: hypothetical protein K6T54_07005 [Ignavibacterium sp.]|nr:hypothetical protein [Ignavibacterium sp.]
MISKEEEQKLYEWAKNETSMHILKNPYLFDEITLKEFDKKIAGEYESRRAIFLVLCSIFVKNIPSYVMNLMVNSEASAGKSYLCKKIIEIFPKNLWEYRTKITPEAFTYWHNEEDWTWDGKICYLEDIDQKILDSPVFKVMCSEGSIATVVIKQKSYDRIINGKPIMLITTSSTHPNSEIIARFQMISCDETEEQTKRILEKRAKFMERGFVEEYDEKITQALGCLQRVNVKIPSASFLIRFFPMNILRTRREFDRFLTLICSSCALHQYQREKDEEGYFLPTLQDILLAREVMLTIIKSSSFYGLTHRLKRAYNSCIRLSEQKENGWFTVKEIREFDPFVSEKMWYIYLDRLTSLNLLVIKYEKKEGSDKKVTFYRCLKTDFGFDKFQEDYFKKAFEVNEQNEVNEVNLFLKHETMVKNNKTKKTEPHYNQEDVNSFNSFNSFYVNYNQEDVNSFNSFNSFYVKNNKTSCSCEDDISYNCSDKKTTLTEKQKNIPEEYDPEVVESYEKVED